MKQLMCLAAILAAFNVVGRIDADSAAAWSAVIAQLRTEQTIAREGYARTFDFYRAGGQQ
jgi:hypothetical protein